MSETQDEKSRECVLTSTQLRCRERRHLGILVQRPLLALHHRVSAPPRGAAPAPRHGTAPPKHADGLAANVAGEDADRVSGREWRRDAGCGVE